ncbi:MAG: hypothetical protein FH749_05755 [Firmicutes bacterium]|nr:hypothetical protein [Bacillota bacterium]
MDEIIAVVGNCAAGKTTLVKNLNDLGYNARNVPQEHSEVRRLWKYKRPTVLVMLTCTFETACKRRPSFAWSEKQLQIQQQRLKFAREECDLLIITDPLSIDEVTQTVVDFLEKRSRANEQTNHS